MEYVERKWRNKVYFSELEEKYIPYDYFIEFEFEERNMMFYQSVIENHLKTIQEDQTLKVHDFKEVLLTNEELERLNELNNRNSKKIKNDNAVNRFVKWGFVTPKSFVKSLFGSEYKESTLKHAKNCLYHKLDEEFNNKFNKEKKKELYEKQKNKIDNCVSLMDMLNLQLDWFIPSKIEPFVSFNKK